MLRRPLASLVLLASLALPPASAQAPAGADRMLVSIDQRAGAYATVAHQIWSYAEVGYQETRSSALLQQQLREAGFKVEAGVASMPTAFVATWGSGRPVLGIVGEFDALPGLSQDSVPVRKPLLDGGPGHGCGHHLFGTASVAAAIALKDWMATTGQKGTIKVLGTPAEEGGGGKIYMIRAGLFEGVDAVLAWHPGDENVVSRGTTLANIAAKFRFHGKSAHAAAAPDQGRSALDAVEAMDDMVNLMREHVPQETRIHYIITNGGKAPNVVPDFAESYYYARHSDMRILDGIWDRIVDAGKGAALGTGTTVEVELVNAVYNVLPNTALADVMDQALKVVGGVTYDAHDRDFAAEIRTTLADTTLPIGDEATIHHSDGSLSSASSDLGDVSWVTPMVELVAATWVPGTPAHSWQATAAGGMDIGAKGMIVAAKTLALTGAMLFSDPASLDRAQAEQTRRLAGFVYQSRIGDRAPPLDYRK